MKSPIELLSPAKDIECGKAAIDHGADAVYIGGPLFGARKAAGNTMADIERLAAYAHRYHARVYLTLNTILYDTEIEQARTLAVKAWDAGVDALIIQDMAMLELDLPPLPLIASTQMNNESIGHIRFLEDAGFSRAILARELSLEQIRAIRQSVQIELESFVHGSLCVGASGRCYLSHYIGGRSSNRGECGQPCRLPWTLKDGEGNIIERDRYLLSLKDMDRSDYLLDMVNAGIGSFKIEGRLKDISYVKNTTAFYRMRLDSILDTGMPCKSASSGTCTFSFDPNPVKTFYRGGTDYFLVKDGSDISSPNTPKSLGEEIGTVTRCRSTWFCLRGDDKKGKRIYPGDGLCFFDRDRQLKGLQIVRTEEGRVHVRFSLSGLKPGMKVFRNRNHRFLKQLDGKSSERSVRLDLIFREVADGFELEGIDEDNIRASARIEDVKVQADNIESAMDIIKRQLLKLGNTMFTPGGLELQSKHYFINRASLNRLRRDLVDNMIQARMDAYRRPLRREPSVSGFDYPVDELDCCFNVSNNKARQFYKDHGVKEISPAFELDKPSKGAVVMTARHCIRRLLGACLKESHDKDMKGPLFIEHENRRFRLEFDCETCCMKVVAD